MYTRKIELFIFLILFGTWSSLAQQKSKNENQNAMAKFEPVDGECLFFIGQDMAATGGLNDYSDGYCDHFEMPAGITVYTGFSPGDESFGYIQKGNDGLTSIANWGAGDTCAQCYVEDDNFKYSIMAIGLSLVGHEKMVAKGQHDDLIKALGQWIIDAKRPIFLRIGYEFDGWDWNHYNKKHYLSAWRRIHSLFAEMKVDNVAFVWQSKGSGSGQDILEAWYPGDDLVDWCAYSYFGNPDKEMLTFARKHHKPVFIAEATPIIQVDTLFFNSQLSNPQVAQHAWDQWFVPFFNTLNANKDVIKAFSYINTNWSIEPMWINNPVFQKVDSRLQESNYISQKWKEELSKPRYLKSSAYLWDSLRR
jgi:hypothetical protein